MDARAPGWKPTLESIVNRSASVTVRKPHTPRLTFPVNVRRLAFVK